MKIWDKDTTEMNMYCCCYMNREMKTVSFVCKL